MARKEVVTAEERAKSLVAKQRKLKDKLNKKSTRSIYGRFEGELNHLKFVAITMRIASMKNEDIANALGETPDTINMWFNDNDVKALYTATLDEMSHASIQLLQSYTLEAIHCLVDVMRHGSNKESLEAAKEILDRGGVPKISKSEQKIEKREVRTVDSDIISRIQEAAGNPEQEEALIPIYEMLEKAANGEN